MQHDDGSVFITNSASTFFSPISIVHTPYQMSRSITHTPILLSSSPLLLSQSERKRSPVFPFAERNRFAKPPACCLPPRTVAAPSAMSKTCVWSGLERANLFVLYNKDGLSLGCSFMMRGVSSKLSAPVSPSYTIRALDTVGMRTEIPVCISSFSWSRSLCSLITSRQLPPFSPAQSHTRRRSRVRE